MDKSIRNLIQKATQDARRLLEAEFAGQLEGTFDILSDGHMAPLPGKHLSDEQKIIREKITAAIAHEKAGGVSDAGAVAGYLREVCFTTLNRFAALKMLEARGLVQECASKGDQSAGFKEFCGLAPGLAVFPDKGYRLYIESLFDELGTEIRVLFDRRDPASLLWPGKKALDGVLEIFNRQEIEGVWAEDETIGWIYQYFNSAEERKKMREESAAPRNSRELAVRNQFFTPRYVVAFLTDNTLGRIWYEMCQGNTRLKDYCRYLVRRPVEVFLKPGETAPETISRDDLSQEELLKQPVYISHRQLKDPRDIKMLDPACGSLHFGIYAFDLFEIIYEEAWELESLLGKESFVRSSGLLPLTETYGDKDAFMMDMPRLIIEHNIHGIDIDSRAVQIGTMALWMRAQRSWQRLDIKAADRPRIQRSNIVTAEPMPGEKDMLKEFTAGLSPRVLGQLVEVIFDKMKLAGEAGSLLKIEEEIKNEVAKARHQWLSVPKPEQLLLFSDQNGPKPKQQQLKFDLSGITDETFWEQAEDRILDALKKYSEQAENGRNAHRRLFAEDAARGFAFINLCRKRYDVVLMNPPFGLGSKNSERYLNAGYVCSGASEVCASFYSRVVELLHDHSFFGAISSRTFYYLHSLKEWRCEEGFAKSTLQHWIDLGQGILDDAMNETAAYIVLKGRIENHISSFGMYHREHDKEAAVASFVRKRHGYFFRPLTDFEKLPDKPLCYWVSNSFVRNLSSLKVFGDEVADVQMGLAPRDEFRFSRLWWEAKSNEIGRDRSYLPYAKGGELSPYYSDVELLLLAKNDLEEIKTALNQKYPYLKGNLSWVLHPENNYFQPGLTFGQRTTFLRVSILPEGSYFSVAGKGIFGQTLSNELLLQLINTPSCQYLVSLRRERLDLDPQYQEGDVARMPWPDIPLDLVQILEQAGIKSAENVRLIASFNEVDHSFVCLKNQKEVEDAHVQAQTVIKQNEMEADLSFSSLLGLDEQDRRFIDQEILPRWHSRSIANWYVPSDADSIHYMLGLVFCRWDIRIALDPSLAPKLPDPFDPLPVCPPGMLVGPDGLPAEHNRIVSEEWLRARPDAITLPPENSVKNPTITDADYPLRISWDGILVDDPGFNSDQPHHEDIVRRVREVLDVIWKDKAADIEQEACDILNVPDLRTWFRKSFFIDHIRRYSKSRRKAPIYWQLSTPSASYSVWLYYHRFTKDTFYKVLNDFITPKLRFEERELTNTRQQYGPGPTSGQRKEISARETFVAELKTFKDEVARIAPLWNPDLNDGVIINFAPLWRLVPQNRSWQKECKIVWDKLIHGDYDWAHLAMHLWPERVVPKCIKDRSLAIAHDLDEFFWEEDDKGKSQPKKVSKETVEALIAERTSPTVKAALEDLLNASDVGKKDSKKPSRRL